MILVPQNNDFEIRLQVTLTDGTIIPAESLSAVAATMGMLGKEKSVEVGFFNGRVCVACPSSLQLGKYNVHIYAQLDGRDIACHMQDVFCIVPFGDAAQTEVVEGSIAIIGMTDEQITALKENLARQIDATRRERERYEEMYENAYESLYNMQPTIYSAALQMEEVKQAADASKVAAEAARAAAEAIDVPADVASAENVRQAKNEILTAIGKIEVDVPADIARKGDVEAVGDHLDNVTDLQIGKVQDGIGNLQDQMSETIGRDAEGVTLHQKADDQADAIDGLNTTSNTIKNSLGVDNVTHASVHNKLNSINAKADTFAQELDTIKNLLTITQAEVTNLLNA